MRIFSTVALVALTTLPAGTSFAQTAPMGGMHQHGAGGMMRHDMMTMPGLRGVDASPEESGELQVMFMHFPDINREVELLENGIRTYTWSDDPMLAGVIISHVAGMTTRVDEGRDPQVFIQSPTLDILFERRDTITTEIETTETGVWVTQTSTDPEVVEALQVHAGEVSDMAERGMEAVHEMMMKRAAVGN